MKKETGVKLILFIFVIIVLIYSQLGLAQIANVHSACSCVTSCPSYCEKDTKCYFWGCGCQLFSCQWATYELKPSCSDKCVGDTRNYNGDTECTSSGWSSCSYSTENCNAYDWCYSYGSGCEERDYYCRSSDVTCQYIVSDRHTDSSCSDTGCSADKCEITRTFLDYDCHWTSQCTATTESCSSINCPSGTACSGGSCSSGNSCGTANCLSDRCVGMTFYDYPDTCNKKCDGSGNCNGCPAGSCDPTTEECTASGCCEPTCSASGGCGSIRDDSNCPPYCSGDTRYYNGDCGTGCTCSDYSTENCANKDDSCGAGGCSSGKRPNWGCSGGNCVVESCSCSSACCCDSWENQLCGASCGTAGTCAANERCQHRDCCSECSYSEWRCVSDPSCTIDCSMYGDQTSCNADVNCAWCTGDNTCKNAVNVECQPPSCSDDDLCTASCTWQDCGTQSCPPDGCSGSTYNDYPATCNKGCSGGSCQACTCAPTPHDCSQPGNWDADAIACNCDCGGYDVEELQANGNCDDGLDNDCDGVTDDDDPGCPLICTPDGCNANCPAGCTVSEDPDCGCQDGNGCCAPGCSNLNDDDCPPGMCSLTTASVSSKCAGGASTDCEVGETIDIEGEFVGACTIDVNTYFRIKTQSLDGICVVDLVKQNPSLVPDSTLNTVNLIAVADGRVIFDREYDPSGCNGECPCVDTPLGPVDDPEFCFDHYTTGTVEAAWDQNFEPSGSENVARSYIEWDISSIHDASSVSNVDFIYHGRWGYGAARNIYINRMDSRAIDYPLLSSLFNDIRTGPRYASHYPTTSPNTLVDLDNDARNDLENALGTRDWFGIGFHLSAEGIDDTLVAEIYSKEYASANPKPTLRVEYYPPIISDTWTISSISGSCEGKTVYAYEAELWDGAPGVGTIITRVSDTIPTDPSPVGGSFKFATAICTPDGCNANCPAGCTVSEDPDCGCQDGNGCCGIGCDATNDNDCIISCSSNADCNDFEYCTIDTCMNPGTPGSFCSYTNRPDSTDCGDCKICSSGICVDKSKLSCADCKGGPYCNPVTDTWYCTNKGLCDLCSGGYCDGLGNCLSNPCGTCKYCSAGSCTNRNNGYNDCGSGCQRCVDGSCQDYNAACLGTISSCYCNNDICESCLSSGCCDVSCSSYTCLLSPNDDNCLSHEICNGVTCNCDTVCIPGDVCFRGPWECNGDCERRREIYVWNSLCSCVFDHNQTQYAPSGQHCSGGVFTTSEYCGSSSDYCTQDRYRKVDRYECGDTHICNLYDFTEDLQDCGVTSYSCPTSCTRRYTKTCENGICGIYNVDNPCPLDTSCSGGSCSVNYECSTGSDECISSCEKGKEQRRCDGSGNCNRFWKWLDYELCDPFSCLTGSCSNICDDNCGAEPACDGKTEGESCGIGRECQNCQCVIVACEGYYDETSCSSDPTCAWCSGDNTCKDAISVECQPPVCSGDSHNRCTSECRWEDCGSLDGSCYCSGGSCTACSEPTPRCLNYQCVECISDNDCECYEKCNDLLLNICYDLRYECDDGSTGIGCGIEGTCEYFDSCNSLTCASDPEFCFNADPSLCKDSFSRCHVLRSCA